MKNKYSKKHCPENIPEKFSAVLYTDYDESLVLKDADDAFLRLYGCKAADIGSNVCTLLPHEEYKRLKYYADSCRGKKFTMRYIKTFPDIPDTMWSITIDTGYPIMHCKGKLILDERCRLHTKKYRIFFASAVCSASQEGFRADMFSDGDGSVFERLLSMTSVRMLMERCIGYGCDDSVPEMVYLPGKGLRPVDICAAPFLFRGENKVILTVREKEPPGTIYSGNEPAVLLERELIGCGIISVRSGRYYFEDTNPCLAKMISSGSLRLDDIIHSYPFRSAMEEGMSCFGRLGSADPDSKNIISVIPVQDQGAAVCASVFIIPVDSFDMMDRTILENLSGRECNVLRLAASGLNTREISSALNVSDGTIKKELCSAYKKIGVINRIQAIRKLYHL